MELICTSYGSVNTKVAEIQACCQKNNIEVTVKQLQGQEDLKLMQLDIKAYCVLLIDDRFVYLLENCGKIVSKIIKIISKPNKLIFMKDVADEKFQDLMEMFDSPYRDIKTTSEELVSFCSTKLPTEYDELTNTTTSFSSVNIRSVEPLSGSSVLNEPAFTMPNVQLNRPTAEPVESRHSFSSDDNPVTVEAKGMLNGVQKSNSLQNIPPGCKGQLDISGQCERQINSLPGNCQSVTTNQLYPTLRPQSIMTSYVAAGMSRLESPDVNRTLQSSFSGQSYDSSGPHALPCQSGKGYACHCSLCPSIHQHSDSFPRLNSSQPKSMMWSETGRPGPMNNVNFRPEILNLNRQYTPVYNPNIQSDGSDNRAVSCGRCGHSGFIKQEQNDVGPLSETFHSADGASGMTDKDYIHVNPDKVSIWELKEEVMVMIRDSLDCADHYNWKKLADLHKWSFGKIYQLEQKWRNRKIESPFMHLIEEFQNYTLLDLKEDLQRIPRKDLLQQIEDLQNKGLLFHT